MKEIQITMGTNGYPNNLHDGLVGFSTFEDIEQYIEENGGRICTFRKKDGWDLWEVHKYDTDKLIELTPEEYGDDYSFIYKGDYKSYEEFKKEYSDYEEDTKELWKTYEELSDGEAILKLDLDVFYIIEVETLGYYNDTWTYEIGVLIPN